MAYSVELTKRRLLRDREQLVAALRDYEGGKAEHLKQAERDAVMESINRRLADLNRKLDEIEA